MKEARTVTIRTDDLTDKLIRIYDKVPELRGKSPSRVVSIAFEEFFEKIHN